MTGRRTITASPLTERTKARVRPLILLLLTLAVLVASGAHSVAVWLVYLAFVVLYSAWCLRLSLLFFADRRLGYLLSLSDTAILLPLIVWSSSVLMRVLLVLVCAAGFVLSWAADKAQRSAQRTPRRGQSGQRAWSGAEPPVQDEPEAGLERAVRARLGLFATTGNRFGLVMLRLVRFEETVSYYGEETSRRMTAAVGRRGLRLLGPDAQHFVLSGGRVAFLFGTDRESHEREGGTRDDQGGLSAWENPYDIEGLAMALARKVCEHLVDGRRVECVVGWASAPADGVSAEDLLFVAESGAQSTAAFRRVTGSHTRVPERAQAATG